MIIIFSLILIIYIARPFIYNYILLRMIFHFFLSLLYISLSRSISWSFEFFSSRPTWTHKQQKQTKKEKETTPAPLPQLYSPLKIPKQAKNCYYTNYPLFQKTNCIPYSSISQRDKKDHDKQKNMKNAPPKTQKTKHKIIYRTRHNFSLLLYIPPAMALKSPPPHPYIFFFHESVDRVSATLFNR